jgi:histidinol-phosphate/aromatic aminotransferase/cobyric acid decarboxylase-like protein
MVNNIFRKRLKFKDDYTYLNRNMVMEKHPDHIHQSLLKTFKVEDLNQYPDMWRSYEVLSNHLEVPQDQLLITRGTEGALKQVYETFNLSGKSVGVIVPTYAMYSVYSSAYNVNHIPIKGTAPDYKLSVEDIKKFAKEIDVLFLVNPSSHLSNSFTDEELEEIINFYKDNDAIVFLDEVYTGWEAESYLTHLSRHDNLIISSSFSKIGFPCIKTGWLATNKQLKNKLESTRSSYELDYFSCKSLEFIINNQEYLDGFKKKLLKTKRRWIEKLSHATDFKVYDSMLYTLRIYSENRDLIKRIYNNLYTKKIVVHVEDEINLIFSVCADKKIEKDFFEGVSI